MKKNNSRFWRTSAFVLLVVALLSQFFTLRLEPKFNFTQKPKPTSTTTNIDSSELVRKVIPAEGVALPISWGDLGQKMITDGVIDEEKFKALFASLSAEEESALKGVVDNVTMTEANSRFWLDMFWAFGLANENVILTAGEMTDEKYGGDASRFASTGGWTVSTGPSIEHYSRHPYVLLNPQQQELVDRVSSGIYRPCCGNSTHFPDCNHGMAMLGLLELMAANNVGEEEMYEIALKVNSYWFPQTYLDLATYFKEQGQDWGQVDAKVALSSQYSSAQGYAATRQKVKSLPQVDQSGGSCGA